MERDREVEREEEGSEGERGWNENVEKNGGGLK